MHTSVPESQPTETPGLVSIIVPAYNGERYLRQALDSILAQTYASFEVIVMDDASTDGTHAVIESYSQRVRSYRQEHNRGIYDNMNDGIGLARGEFVAFYHSDDIYDPRILEHEVGYLQAHPSVGAVFCEDIFIDADGRPYGRLELPREVSGERPLNYEAVLNALLLYKNRFLRCPTSLVRADVYRTLGGYRQDLYKNTSDLDMWLRIARSYPIAILEKHLLQYRHGHGNSGQRYRHLRTDPERFFTIMDAYLAAGGREIARPDALAAYEAHRAQDDLLRATSLYIRGEQAETARVLASIKARRFLASTKLQRAQMLLLLGMMRALVRAPWSTRVARVLYWRWHAGTATLQPKAHPEPAR